MRPMEPKIGFYRNAGDGMATLVREIHREEDGTWTLPACGPGEFLVLLNPAAGPMLGPAVIAPPPTRYAARLGVATFAVSGWGGGPLQCAKGPAGHLAMERPVCRRPHGLMGPGRSAAPG